MKHSIDIYQDKRGNWRWRFRVNEDIQAVSSDSFPVAGDAEINARQIICTPWTVEVKYKVNLSWWRKLINYFTR